jgi:hypothetical protein
MSGLQGMRWGDALTVTSCDLDFFFAPEKMPNLRVFFLPAWTSDLAL